MTKKDATRDAKILVDIMSQLKWTEKRLRDACQALLEALDEYERIRREKYRH